MANMGMAAIGECMLELSGREGQTWRMGFAGDTLNTLWALKALAGDREATYVSAFGDDPFSRDQVDFLESNGIGIGSSPTIPGARPGLYAITLKGAERSFTYWRSDSAARQLASDPVRLGESLGKQSLVYFSGITLAILDAGARARLIEAVAEARRAGSLVAFDANYRARLWAGADEARRSIESALAVTDIALPSFSDEQSLFGDASPEATAGRLAALGVSEIVVKDGEGPAFVRCGEVVQPVPAARVGAVDTTGAGDAFNGGYLAARLAGHLPAAATRQGHAVAAAVVQVFGALAPFAELRKAFEAGVTA